MTQAPTPTLSGMPPRALQLCSFWLEGRLFGVDILDVKEIGDNVDITPISHAPASVLGYISIRGQIHLVMDLRHAFRFERSDFSPTPSVILFRASVDEPFGVLVDRVDDVVTIHTNQIEERRRKQRDAVSVDRRRAPPEVSLGVCRLERGLMVVLNARGILPALTGKQVSRPVTPGEEKK